MLVELQTLVVNRSILSKALLLADDLEQWDSVLSQTNTAEGKNTKVLMQRPCNGTLYEKN